MKDPEQMTLTFARQTCVGGSLVTVRVSVRNTNPQNIVSHWMVSECQARNFKNCD